MNTKEKLRFLIQLRNPDLMTEEIMANKAILDAINAIRQGDKGEDGYTPVKGVDYFTAEEIDAIVAHIQSNVKDGVPGEKGEPGESIAGPAGKNGKTPVLGVDYWTKKDHEKILKQVLAMIPKPEKPQTVSAKEIVAEMKKIPVKYHEIENAPDLTDIKKLVKFLKAGGFRGGGSSGLTKETPSGTINDTNLIFTVVHQPFFINVNGLFYEAGDGIYTSYSAGTITLNTPVGTGGFIKSYY